MSFDDVIMAYEKGQKDLLNEIVAIMKKSNYPEDLELEMYDWLFEKGVKLYDN